MKKGIVPMKIIENEELKLAFITVNPLCKAP